MTTFVLVGAAVLGAVMIFGATPPVVGWTLLIAGLLGLLASVDRRHYR
ncbi:MULTISPECIES: hypothetical protein [Streptomyces]|nr:MULTISPECIES: hypothetical protein [Streptomyces]